MAGKYISIDHAATRLSMSVDDLNRLREKGELRGFSDRGTWKFRVEDIEEYARQRQADSDAEFDIMFDDIITENQGSGTIKIPADDSDSDVRLAGNDSSDYEHSMEIDLTGSDSDSDVRLVNNEIEIDISDEKETGTDADSPLMDSASFNWGSLSDSDVRLVTTDNKGKHEIDTDSDIALSDSSMALKDADPMEYSFEADELINDEDKSDSDSDVQLVSNESKAGSDSDVKLVGNKKGSMDNDIMLMDENEGESDVRFLSSVTPDAPDSDSDVQLVSDSGGLSNDSGLTLSPFTDSSLTLEGPGDSEVSLLADEGSQLYGGSGITLASDSGISLELAADSGISLSGDDEDDGGITLELASDSGLTLDNPPAKSKQAGKPAGKKGKPSDFNATAPMMDLSKGKDKSSGEVTSFDFDLSDEGDVDDSYQLSAGSRDADNEGQTQVIMFDDDESAELDAPTLMRGKSSSKNKNKKVEDTSEDSVFDLGAVDADEEEEDLFSDEDDLDIADDVVGEDDEVDDLDIFDSSADEEFAEDFESDGSEPEYATTSSRAAPAAEAEWGAGSFLLVLACSFIMLPAALVMFELVHSMWSFQAPVTPSNLILDSLAGLYKS